MNLENDSANQQVNPSKWVDMSKEQIPADMKMQERPLPNGFPNGDADDKFLYFDGGEDGTADDRSDGADGVDNAMDGEDADKNAGEPNPKQADGEEKENIDPLINLDIFWNKNPQLSVEMTRKMVEDSAGDPSQKERLTKRMEEFENRAKEHGLDPRTISRTYEQVSRLLTSDDGDNPQPLVTKKERQQIAEQILDNAAHPTSIKQDRRLTCSAAALEVRTYSRTPDKAAKAVTDVVTNGNFSTSDGKTKIDFKPSELKSDNAKERSDASRIFQVLAMNLHFQAAESVAGLEGTVPPGTIRYEQRVPENDGDTGERLIDTRKPDGKSLIMMDGKPVPPHQIDLRTQSNQITGLHEKMVSIVGEQDVHTIHENETNVRNVAEFEAELKRLKAEKGFPVIVGVDTLNEPFWSDHSEKQRNKPGFTGGGHIVTIMDFDESKGEVSVDNTWSDSRDHLGKAHNSQARIPLKQMFNSMIQAPEPREKPSGKDAPLVEPPEKSNKEAPQAVPPENNLLQRSKSAKTSNGDEPAPLITATPVYVNRVTSPNSKR